MMVYAHYYSITMATQLQHLLYFHRFPANLGRRGGWYSSYAYSLWVTLVYCVCFYSVWMCSEQEGKILSFVRSYRFVCTYTYTVRMKIFIFSKNLNLWFKEHRLQDNNKMFYNYSNGMLWTQFFCLQCTVHRGKIRLNSFIAEHRLFMLLTKK